MKRCLDIFVAGVGILVLSPLMALVSIIIFFSMGRPILFRQKRAGLHGKPFVLFKFRSMLESENDRGEVLPDEKRLTRIGKFLRGTSLDELPEFWNVLRGHMSLVGPRPLPMEYLKRYTPGQKKRHSVQPGLTGWAQVNGRNGLSWEKKFEYDIWYVSHWSLWLDIKILFLTMIRVIERQGISNSGHVTMPEFTGSPLSMSSPSIDENDVRAVTAVLKSKVLSLGPKADEFERQMAKYVGTKHAIAVSSGTAALHLIVKALGIGSGDEVLVPSFTFAASVNPILFEGATPVFVDINSETYTLDPKDLESKITPRTKALMAVDIFGHPVEWDEILGICKEHRLKIIDDSCEALGSKYREKSVGQFGEAAAFAFYPNKQITTGEGGMVVTNDDKVADFTRSVRNQGRDEMNEWLVHSRMGYNYRMDELSAALGVSQLRRIDEFLAKRERVAHLYTKRLQEFDWISPPVVKPYVQMSWFVYVITLAEGIDRDGVIQKLGERGIPSRAYFPPIHLQPYWQKRGKKRSVLPITESIARRTVALPFHNDLSESQVDFVVQTLRDSVQTGDSLAA